MRAASIKMEAETRRGADYTEKGPTQRNKYGESYKQQAQSQKLQGVRFQKGGSKAVMRSMRMKYRPCDLARKRLLETLVTAILCC